MVLKKESFPTIPLLIKSFMDVKAVCTISTQYSLFWEISKILEDKHV